MKKITNRIWAVVLAMVLTVSTMTATPVVAATTTTNTAYVTIEKLTLGQGFVLEPTKVTFNEGESIDDVVKKAAKDQGIELVYSTSEYGSFLTGIKKADNGKVNIPAEITALGDFGTYPAPSNENIKKNDSADGTIETYTYTDMSGWMYFVNNESISEAASNIKAKNGDVIRLQFSIYGWGLDLGLPDFNTGSKVIELANKDALIVTLADLKADGVLDKSKSVKQYYDYAMENLATYKGIEGCIRISV